MDNLCVCRNYRYYRNRCVCNHLPVCEVCPNYEVVVFQPWTVNPPQLGTVSIVADFIYRLPAPPDSTVILESFFPSSIPPSPHHQLFIGVSLYLFAPTPHLLSWREAPPAWTSPVPATRQPLLLVTLPCIACLLLPPLHLLVYL